MRPWFLSLCLSACATPSPPEAPTQTDPSLEVVASTAPVGWLTQRLLGDAGQVTVMVPEDADPTRWTPSPEALAALTTADLVVAQGAGYEPWLATANLPLDRAVITTKGLDLVSRPGKAHRHGDGELHHHGDEDPHTWLDPLMFLAQAQAIHRHLVRRFPERQPDLDRRLSAVRQELLQTHERITPLLQGLQGRPLATHHPLFDTMGRRYGFQVHTVDLDPQGPWQADHRDALSQWLGRQGARAGQARFFWQQPPHDDVRAQMPSIQQLVVDPMSQPVDGRYDWADRLLALARQLAGDTADP